LRRERYTSFSAIVIRSQKKLIEHMETRLRTAVIGAGYLGRFHAQKYAAHDACDLVAVADVSDTVRARLHEELGVKATGDHRELLDDVDAVSIVVPTDLHYGIARECLQRGIHVLLEKPMTVTVAEADELIALAEAHCAVLQIGHLERFNPAMVAMAERVSSPRFFEAYRVAPFRERGIEVDVVRDLMIHDLDLVQHLARSPVKDVTANGAIVFSDKPDIVNARVEFESGCVANLTASRISTKTERKIRMFQQDNYMSADLFARYLKVCTKLDPEPGESIPRVEIDQHEYGEYDALRLEIDAFVSSIRDGAPVAVTGEEGRNALATAALIGDLIGAN
jgi:predicted dehydrogenase